jgi:cell division septum initiation protein DivIVA
VVEDATEREHRFTAFRRVSTRHIGTSVLPTVGDQGHPARRRGATVHDRRDYVVREREPRRGLRDEGSARATNRWSEHVSISEQGPPEFSSAFRGYERTQVDEYLASLREHASQIEGRARTAESALVQCRRELASSPGTVGVSERLAAILQLANEEAGEIRSRARADSETTTEQAASQARRTIDDANQQRDAIQREIDELAAIREEMLQRLIELGGQIVGATERYQGRAPGASRPATSRVQLFDAEVVDAEPGIESQQAADPDADTYGTSSTDSPEHQQ